MQDFVEVIQDFKGNSDLCEPYKIEQVDTA